MPIGNELYLENTIEVLKALLVSADEIHRRKNQLSGYGMRKEDFDKIPFVRFNERGEKPHKASSKMFWSRKKSLQENCYIRPLESKGNRNKYYGITPIGIIYFCSNVKQLDKAVLEKIFSMLRFYYEKGKPKSENSYIDKLENAISLLGIKKIKEDLVFDEEFVLTFHDILKFIRIDDNESYLSVSLLYESPTMGLDISVGQLFFWRKNNRYEYYDINSSIIDGKAQPISENEFNYLISKFIIKAFLHTLYIDYKIIIQAEPKYKKQFMELFKAFNESSFGVAKEFHDELTTALKVHTKNLVGAIQ